MILSSTARRYAEAAFDVASRQGDAATWIAELRGAGEALQSPEVMHYFRDPNVAREEKFATIDRAFSGVRPQIRNLLRMLAARDRLTLIPAITQEMTRLDREARGVLEATVTTARPISADEQGEIARRLGTVTGKQVALTSKIDPELLGGVVIRIGDKLIDASVAGRFERLRQQLAV